MELIRAAVLGIVQGLTEFLPISSSGHLRIVPAFFGWDDPGSAFTAVIQLGTMVAVVVYFREDLLRILTTWYRSLREPALRSELDARMGWYIGLGTVPIAIVGLALKDPIESGGRSLYLIGAALVVFSFAMLAAEREGRRHPERRGVESIKRRDAIGIGLAQTLALCPGVSRSGATISAGLFLGLDRTAAARYSFLLSIPAVVLSGLFELKDVGGDSGYSLGPTLVSVLLAFVVGYASIAFLLKFVARHTIEVFVGYRIVVGAAVLVLTAASVIS